MLKTAGCSLEDKSKKKASPLSNMSEQPALKRDGTMEVTAQVKKLKKVCLEAIKPWMN